MLCYQRNDRIGEVYIMAMIGVQTGGLTRLYGIDGAYRAIREAGFDAADVNLDELLPYRDILDQKRPPVFSSTFEECYFHPYRAAAEKYGIVNAQAHAPFPSWVADFDKAGDYNEYLLHVMEITIAGCACIGCKKLVVHPFFGTYENMLSEEAEWELNKSAYAHLIPAAKKWGVTILLENMFVRHRGKIYQACCSDFHQAARYVDVLNELAGEKIFGFCMDTGHALLVGKDIKHALTALGSRIEAFHIHDNNGIDDQHLAPYMGVLDWDRFVEGLREIGYHGHLSFETHGTVERAFDPELVPEALRLIARSGRMFAERAGV